jgi:peptidyl-tRNA hydrolase, PTH1 family
MFIVAGLGNPGAQYDRTRHNVGFDAIEYLAASYRIPLNKIRYKALVGEGVIQGIRVLLVKPQTFMNLSGDSIHEILHFYKEPPENLVVIYDDVDLPVGRLRVRPSGSAGTHNGMRSVLARVGTDGFTRVRIGIGRPPEGWDLADYVLSRFGAAERETVNEAIERACTAVSAILSAGPEAAMNRYNG